MNPHNILVFFLPFIFPTFGILRPGNNPDNSVPDSDRRQSNQGNPRPFISRPVVNPPNNLQQQPQPPSRELLPPLVSPLAPVVGQSNPSPPVPAPQSQNSEQLELLPPVEIPPEFPIDNLPQPSSPPQQERRPSAGRPVNRPIVFESPSVNEFVPFPPLGPEGLEPSQSSQGRQPSSLVPTTGSGGSFDNGVPANVFPNPRPTLAAERQRQRPSFRLTPAPKRQQTSDPGLDCLGTCECPSDFTFVCGSNRFLYQNDCALECDKRCHPGLVKLDMSECS